MTTPLQPQYVRIGDDYSIPLDSIIRCYTSEAALFVQILHNTNLLRFYFGEPKIAEKMAATIQAAIDSRNHLNEDKEPDPRQPAKDYYVDPRTLPLLQPETCATEPNSRPCRRLVRVGDQFTIPDDSITSIRLERDQVIVDQFTDGKCNRSIVEFDEDSYAKLAYNQALKDWSGSEEYKVK